MSCGASNCESSLVSEEEHAAHLDWEFSVLNQIGLAALDESGRHPELEVEVSGELFGKRFDLKCRLPRASPTGELNGVLFGTRGSERVHIHAFRPLLSPNGMGRSSTLSEDHRQALLALIAAAPADRDLCGLEPVGWFRAHPNIKLSLSRRDLEVFHYFFNEPWQVALLLRPARSAPASAKLFLREPDGSFHPERGFREFTIPVPPDSSMSCVEREPPPSQLPNAAPAPLIPAMQRLHPGTSRMPVWPPLLIFGLLVSSAFGIVYWWSGLSEQVPLRAPLKTLPAANTEADRHRQLDEQVNALWQQWNEKAPGEKTQVAVLPHESGAQPTGMRPEEALSVPPKSPRAPVTVRVKRARPAPASSQRASSRRSFLTASPPRKPPTAPQPRPVALAHELVETPAAVSTPSQKKEPAPPLVARETSPAVPAQVQPVSSASPDVGTPAAPPPRTSAATAGRLIWTGKLRKNETLIISGTKASTGSLTGELPGKPLRFTIWPGDLTDRGILLYASSMSGAGSVTESPGPQNGWNKTVYQLNPRRAADIAVVEPPCPGNDWKRLVLRSRRSGLSIIVAEWAAH